MNSYGFCHEILGNVASEVWVSHFAKPQVVVSAKLGNDAPSRGIQCKTKAIFLSLAFIESLSKREQSLMEVRADFGIVIEAGKRVERSR
jgi:hypothetical protein